MLHILHVKTTIKIVSGVEQSGIPDTIGWTKPLSGSYGDSIERLSPIKCFYLSTMVALGQLNRILATIGESFCIRAWSLTGIITKVSLFRGRKDIPSPLRANCGLK